LCSFISFLTVLMDCEKLILLPSDEQFKSEVDAYQPILGLFLEGFHSRRLDHLIGIVSISPRLLKIEKELSEME
jgi:hypothetical protein